MDFLVRPDHMQAFVGLPAIHIWTSLVKLQIPFRPPHFTVGKSDTKDHKESRGPKTNLNPITRLPVQG